jgi:hypothetical protein
VARLLASMAASMIQIVRNGQFRSRYWGRYKAFFTEAAPEVMKRLAGVEGASGVGRQQAAGR